VDWELILVFISLIFSFIFSASETALTALGRLEIEKIKANGGNHAKLIERWIYKPDRILTEILVGNNVANVAASSLFTLWAERKFEINLGWFMVMFTIFLILFVEIIPKLGARKSAEKSSFYVLKFLHYVRFILAPLVIISSLFTDLLTKKSKSFRTSLHPGFSEEQLTHTIKIAAEEGGIDKETGIALEKLVDFPDTLARDVMTPRSKVISLPVNFDIHKVIETIKEYNYSRYPVIRKDLDNVMGILLVKDLVAKMKVANFSNWTSIVRKPNYVSELAPLGTILKDMKKTGIHMGFVRNETGVLTGILTFEDVIEEIVGEVRDEHDDPSEAGTESAMGGPQNIDGDMGVVDFNNRFEGSIPLDVSYSTINGYLLTRCGGQMAKAGTLIIDDNFSFRIKSVNKKGIATIEIVEHSANDD